MFGFGSTARRQVAIALLDTMETLQLRYNNCSRDFLISDITARYDEDHRIFQGNQARIAEKTLPEFVFDIEEPDAFSGTDRRFSVFGRGAYEGLMICGHGPRSNWFSSADGDAMVRTTSAAKKLVRLLEKEFGIKDSDRLEAKYGLR